LKFRGFFGIGKGKARYNTRFSAVAVINGSVLFNDLNAMEWLIFDNPHARVRLPDGLMPTTHRFRALDGSRWAWRPVRSLPLSVALRRRSGEGSVSPRRAGRRNGEVAKVTGSALRP
jgi:hypothetical protein